MRTGPISQPRYLGGVVQNRRSYEFGARVRADAPNVLDDVPYMVDFSSNLEALFIYVYQH